MKHQLKLAGITLALLLTLVGGVANALEIKTTYPSEATQIKAEVGETVEIEAHLYNEGGENLIGYVTSENLENIVLSHPDNILISSGEMEVLTIKLSSPEPIDFSGGVHVKYVLQAADSNPSGSGVLIGSEIPLQGEFLPVTENNDTPQENDEQRIDDGKDGSILGNALYIFGIAAVITLVGGAVWKLKKS